MIRARTANKYKLSYVLLFLHYTLKRKKNKNDGLNFYPMYSHQDDT